MINKEQFLSSFQSYSSKNGNYLKKLDRFREYNHLNLKGQFVHQFLWNQSMTNDPASWWKSFCKFDDLKVFSEFALKLFNIPPSTAAVERSFSIESRIQTKVRNRIDQYQVEKLLAIQSMYKVFNKLDTIEEGVENEEILVEDYFNDDLIILN